MRHLTKQFQLWIRSEDYRLIEFNTLEELLEEIALGLTTDFFITQKCDIEKIPVKKEQP
jgi:hypothetical protein